MKKIITLAFVISISISSLFAGKPVSKEPSPLSVLESDAERKSWNEKDGYALVLNQNLHYWLYNSYYYHDGDISDFLFKIVPKWFQNMEYVVAPDYETSSPNNNLADSVKKLMSDSNSDVSITLVKKDDGKPDYVCVNSYDSESNMYSTYIFYGTKADKAKITTENPASLSAEKLYDVVLADIVKALNKNGKSKDGDKFYENLKIAQKAAKRGTNTTDQWGNTLPDNGYEYILLRLDQYRKRGNMTKEGIRSIKYACMLHYNVPKNFEIAVGVSEVSLAKVINSLPYIGL